MNHNKHFEELISTAASLHDLKSIQVHHQDTNMLKWYFGPISCPKDMINMEYLDRTAKAIIDYFMSVSEKDTMLYSYSLNSTSCGRVRFYVIFGDTSETTQLKQARSLNKWNLILTHQRCKKQ